MKAKRTAIISQAPGRCPRRAAKKAAAGPARPEEWVRLKDLHHEPFRLFFPLATLAGIAGVALWPLMLLGWTEVYPGPSHARLMVQGFFGGFVLGFLGTAMPRLLDARPFSASEAFAVLFLFVGNIAANAMNMTALSDSLFLTELIVLIGVLGRRYRARRDNPPPSFVLVGMGFMAAMAGTAIHLAGSRWELSPPLEYLSRSLAYHGFVLLCILGAGGFLLPRFLGLGLRRKYPGGRETAPEWKRALLWATAAGALVLLSYPLEVAGWPRTSGTIRALIICGYLAYEMPLEKLRWSWRGVHWLLILGLASMPLGILAAGWLPSMRATLLHLELVSGFALITLGVATRVLFGHSGGRDKLERFSPWVTATTLLLLLGLASRISGDFLPHIQTTHYLYGAGCWILGCIVWGAFALPRVLRPDPEE